MRMARVLSPRNARKLSNGPAMGPIAFDRNQIFSFSASSATTITPPTMSE